MNSSQISTFIENPSLITANDVDSLKNLANEYSYSETLQLLYLYAVSKHADMKFDEALTSTAYRITNRERILELLGEPTENVFVQEEADTPTAEISAVTTETIVETQAPEVEQEAPVIEFVDEPAIQDEIVAPTRTSEEIDPLEELMYHTTATALEQDYLAAQGIEAATDPETAETDPETTAINDEKETEVSTSRSVEEEKKEITTIPEDSKMSFTSWLHQNHTTEPKKEISSEHKHKVVNPDKQSFVGEEIIDRFIETQPSISKPTAEFYSASKKAKESLDASRNPVSETLAKIYEAQGNYQKAIHVYHQLILNYPEKKSLFAPRIEELKNKLSQ
jgi:hypothetical protein